ncbi:unnamed protein product [Notodromas monacha]|uniref:Uncharacterized protein n=1 Tax=Notodromas monacha TaxID=399045 RepID=A0A7R9GAB6_9CRUS|nr:unnamed protein product [Notodromas monacha]CAG0915160.1 unnamed protein product [Notodromas monacha]
MSMRGRFSKDLKEGVKACLGKNVKITLQALVKMETKGDKTESRVLAFCACRLFVLTAKVPTRIDFHFHYLEIQAIESRKPNQLSLTVCDKVYTFYPAEDGGMEVDNMIICLGTLVKTIFPSVPLECIIRKIDVPNRRIQQMYDHNRQLEEKDVREPSACGGYSMQYACMCDYHGLPYREEVAWDVDTIYLSHDLKELSLRDFDHLDQKDLIPIISALEYNTWFKKFRASGLRLNHESLDRLNAVLRKSLSLEELYLDNVGLKTDHIQKISLAIGENSKTVLHTLDLSHNLIEDRGVSHLVGPIAKLPKGFKKLCLSCCSVSPKAMNQIFQALTANPAQPCPLIHLDLSGNALKEDCPKMYTFMAQPNSITFLDLSGTECSLEAIFGALLRGCTTKLSYLNLSKNTFSTKKGREIPPSFKQFLTTSLALRQLVMASCKLSPEALKNLLLGLACNESTVGVDLDISSNALGSPGAGVLESCAHGIKSLQALDISDNGIESDLAGVIASVSKNKSVKRLNIGRNLSGAKSKHIVLVMDAVVQMIQDDDCVLESLSVADSKLKSDISRLINALGGNHCLCEIDLSGNFMGDSGARLLAKALQINSKLRSVAYDRNGIGLQGFQDIASALESNYSLKSMPFPIHDVMTCLKAAPDKTEAVMKRIQDLLQRNVSPKKYSNGQAFRLQQGFLMSSTQQMVDKLVIQTQDTIRILRQQGDSAISPEIENAEHLICDADNSKQLLTRLHEVVLEKEEGGNPVTLKLKSLSDELQSTIMKYLKDTVDSMVQCAVEQCPRVLGDEAVKKELRKSCEKKCSFCSNIVQGAIVEQAGTDIVNKISEINLAVAAHVSDRIIDEVIESLSKSYKSLHAGVDDLTDVTRTRRSGSAASTGSSNQLGFPNFSPLNGSGSSQSNIMGSILGRVPNNADISPGATPPLSSKRRSLHGRKLRPVSVVDVVEGINADALPVRLPPMSPEESDESLDTVGELPSNGSQLQHLGKARPKRLKTKAPTRPSVRSSYSDADREEQELQEGLDDFFGSTGSAPNSPMSSPTMDDSPRLVKSTSNSVDSSPTHAVLSHQARSSGTAEPRRSDASSDASEHNFSRKGSEKQGKAEKKEKTTSLMVKGISSVFSKMAADKVTKSKDKDKADASISSSCSSRAEKSPSLSRRSEASSPIGMDKIAMSGGSISISSYDESDTLSQASDATLEGGGPPSEGESPDGSLREWSEPRMRKQAGGVPRMGLGVNILAEMKALQEKRASAMYTSKSGDDFGFEDKKKEEKGNASPVLLSSVKLRSTGLADSLKSPTNGFPKTGADVAAGGTATTGSSIFKSSPKNIDPGLGQAIKPTPNSKPKPPPPIAPKPRPKSMAGLDASRSSDMSDASEPNTPESGETLDDKLDSGSISNPMDLRSRPTSVGGAALGCFPTTLPSHPHDFGSTALIGATALTGKRKQNSVPPLQPLPTSGRSASPNRRIGQAAEGSDNPMSGRIPARRLSSAEFEELKETSVDDMKGELFGSDDEKVSEKAIAFLRQPSTPGPAPPSVTQEDLILDDVVNV